MSISPVLGQAEPTPDGPDSPHPAGPAGIQPHGFVLVVRDGPMRIVQASTSAAGWLQRPLSTLLLATLHDLGGDLAAGVGALAPQGMLEEPQPLRCTVGADRAQQVFEGAVVRTAEHTLVVELQPVAAASAALGTPGQDARSALLEGLALRARRFASAATAAELSQAAAEAMRSLFGYDRVTFFRCVHSDGADGTPTVIGESLGGALPPLRGRPLPAHLLGPHERERALRNRAQACADLRAVPSELVPRLLPGGTPEGGGTPDLSCCSLRSPAPAQAALWQALGAVGALRVAVVREGRLWGVLEGHHARPLLLDCGARLAAELLAEVLATRIAALESYTRAQVTAQVHRLEERLLDATAEEGDWRRALLRDETALLQPLAATGALLHHEGEWQGCGLAPPAGLLPPLLPWLQQAGAARPRACTALAEEAPALAALEPPARGLLAVPLTAGGNDWLVWLRASPGASTASAAWTDEQQALATAIGRALGHLIAQVNAVRLLIAQRHLAQVRGAVADAREAVVVVDAALQAFYANEAFHALAGRSRDECNGLEALVDLFTDPGAAHRMVGQARAEQRPWQGELALRLPGGGTLPVLVRAEPVAGRAGTLGTIFTFEDLTAVKHAEAARSHFEARLARASHALRDTGGDALAHAILANASLAGMDISEGGAPPAVAPLLAEVQASAERAAGLLARIRRSGG